MVMRGHNTCNAHLNCSTWASPEVWHLGKSQDADPPIGHIQGTTARSRHMFAEETLVGSSKRLSDSDTADRRLSCSPSPLQQDYDDGRRTTGLFRCSISWRVGPMVVP